MDKIGESIGRRAVFYINREAQTTSVHFIAVHSLRLLQCYKEPTTGSLSTYLRPILTGLESRGKNRTGECYKESSKQIPYLFLIKPSIRALIL
jgi:hypothetical protein